LGKGPKFLKIGARVLYRDEDVEAWEAARLPEHLRTIVFGGSVMPRLPSPNRIKTHYVYTVWEAAQALGRHRQTVILKQAEGGMPVCEMCREHGMSNASFYKWRAKFGGMDASLVAEMKHMAEQNRRLKKMYAEMSTQNDLLKEALGKKR
jgi:putative transposase